MWEDRLFVVTGANSGLGLEAARRLAALPARPMVILACRDLDKGEIARRLIVGETGNPRVRSMRLDLSSMVSVRAFVTRCETELEAPITGLVCNAGISRGPACTVDGIDSVFETNHLGHFLLTVSLLGSMSSDGRVIAVTSDMHEPPGPRLVWPGAEALAHPTGRLARGGRRYSYSKLCNLYFVHELARRLEGTQSRVTAAAFNPGLMIETGFATMPRPVGSILTSVFASRAGHLASSATALAQLVAGAGDPVDFNGLYFDRTAEIPKRSSELSYNEANARQLWQVSATLTGMSD